MNHIIIVRGAPGVGKSTLSLKLAKLFDNGVTIETGPLLKMINKFKDGNSSQYSDTLDIIVILTKSYIEKGYSPIMIIGPFKTERIKNYFFSNLESDTKYSTITLFATNHVLNDRIEKRVIGFKNKEVAYTVNDDILTTILPNEIRIDTSRKSIEEVFEDVLKSLKTMM